MIVKNKLLKSFACILLCLILVFDVTYTKKQEADAFAFVLTPVISKIILTGLVACGVGVTLKDDIKPLISSTWKNMNNSMKEVITLYSKLGEFAGLNLAVFGESAWNDFKNYVSSFFSISGGTLVSDSSGLNYKYPTKVNYVSLYFDSKLLPANGRIDFDENTYFLYTAKNGILIYYFEPLPGLSFDKRIILDLILAKDRFATYEVPELTEDCYFMVTGKGYLDITKYYRLELVGETFNLNYISSDPAKEFVVKTDIPTNLSLQEALYGYLSGGSISKTIDYTIDTPYFPTAEGSICPSVPKDKVMTLPFVNPDTYVPSDTLVSDLLGNVGYQDAPEDLPVSPPITNPDAGFLEKILDWLSSIWDTISSLPAGIALSISDVISKYFDVTEFKLDFSKLKNAGIKDKFPFSIPFDLYNVLKTVLKPVEVPNFNININTIFLKIDYSLPISNSTFQFIRGFFRWSLLFGFIIGLIKGTRNLIKW